MVKSGDYIQSRREKDDLKAVYDTYEQPNIPQEKSPESIRLFAMGKHLEVIREQRLQASNNRNVENALKRNSIGNLGVANARGDYESVS